VDADYDVRVGDLVEPGQLATGLHVVYAPSGARVPDESLRSGHHVLQLSPTFTWGLTRNTDVEMELFAFGVGRGLNDVSERWVLKAVIGLPFGS
jgi:hypothetical protein